MCLSIYLCVAFYPSIYLSLCLCLSIRLSIYRCLSIHTYIYLFLCQSIHPSISLSICLSIYLFVALSFYPSICLCIIFSIYPSIYLCVVFYPFINLLFIYFSVYSSIYPPIMNLWNNMKFKNIKIKPILRNLSWTLPLWISPLTNWRQSVLNPYLTGYNIYHSPYISPVYTFSRQKISSFPAKIIYLFPLNKL